MENGNSDLVEIDDEGPLVAPSKGSKLMVIVASAVLIAVVMYFFLFKGSEKKAAPKNTTDQLVVEGGGDGVTRENINYSSDDLVSEMSNDDFLNELKTPETPELPELPELPDDLNEEIELELKKEIKAEEKVYTKAEVDAMLDDKLAKLQKKLEQKNNRRMDSSSLSDTRKVKTNIKSSYSVEEENPLMDDDIMQTRKIKSMGDRLDAPMFKMKGAGSPSEGRKATNNIVILDKDLMMSIEETGTKITATKTADLARTILQGKIIDAVLESAINTDMPGTVRAIIGRDVYAEYGKNVLIPRGSRLIGAYSTNITRGQARAFITWSRVIRVDGVSININASAADKLGRAGLEGNVDNKYAEILGNAFLSSVLSIATAVAVEDVTDSVGLAQETDDSGNSTGTSGKASDFAILEATKNIMDKTSDMVDEIASTKPTMTIAQGTKIKVLVNQDLVLPIYKKDKKSKNK